MWMIPNEYQENRKGRKCLFDFVLKSAIGQLLKLSQRVFLRLIPGDELADTLVQLHRRMITDFGLQLGGVGICHIDITGLHGAHLHHRLAAYCHLYLMDEIHQAHGM